MKLTRRYIKVLIFIIAIVSSLIINVKVDAGSVINDSTGAIATKPSKDTGCPRCSWYYGGDYASGIRLALYKYDGKGNPVRCGDTLDLLNTANEIESGSLITNGYSKLDYIYGGKSVNFFQGYVYVNSNKSNIRADKVAKYNGGSSYSLTVSDSSQEPWGTAFVKNFSNYLGTTYEEVNTKIKEIFNYHNFDKNEAGKYYITIEPTITVYSRNHNNQKVYGTGYEIISVIDTFNSKEYTYQTVTYDIINDRRCNPSYGEKANEDGTICTASGYTLMGSQGNTFRKHVYNAMFVAQNDAKIFGPDGRYDTYNFVNQNGTGLITAVSGGIPESKAYDTTYAKNNYLKKDYGYGITVLWMQDVVSECEGTSCRTCKNYCNGLSGDALNNCAIDYCKATTGNEDPTCISSCYDTVYDSPGCDRETLHVCYNENAGELKSTGNYCAPQGSSKIFTDLNSKICYDDVSTTRKDYTLETTNIAVDKQTGEISIGTYSTEAAISYYKIECEEKLSFKNMPSRTTSYVTNALTASLYLGYTSEYSKNCQIYYKTSDEGWTTNYNASKIKDEIVKYEEDLDLVENALDDYEKERNAYEQEEQQLLQNIANLNKEIEKLEALAPDEKQKENNQTKLNDDQKKLKDYQKKLKECQIELADIEEIISNINAGKPIIEGVIEELKGIQTEALNQLKKVKDKDSADNIDPINEVTLEYSNQSATGSSKETITLKPVYCSGNYSIKNEKYCDLESNKGHIIIDENNNVTCTNENGTPITAIVNTSSGSSTYTEKVYYSLPSSFTGVDELGNSVVYHDSKEAEKNLESVFEIKNAWVFDPLSKNVSIDKYNSATSTDNLMLKISGLGSCGQFSFELNCGYEFAASTICTKNCIEEYTKTGSQMTQAEYDACFKKYCSCDAYCGSNVACRMQYCPQECEGCEDLSKTSFSCDKGACLEDCSASYAPGEKRLTCNYNCCRTQCNGAVGCIYNCCTSECDAKKAQGYLTNEEYKVCMKTCGFEITDGNDYVYRTINLNRPFPDGDNASGRTPGKNWFGKVEYITESSDATKKYYDATDGRSNEYEYRFVLTSDNVQQLKNNEEINLTYTNFKESEVAKNTYEEATKNRLGNAKANVYCSYIIHDYFKEELGVIATSNSKDVKNNKVVGSGCYTQ